MKIKVILLCWLLIVLAGFPGYSQGKNKECKGFFRWDVKTLTDSSDLTFMFDLPSDSTIEELIAEPPPVKMGILSKKAGHLPRFDSEKHLVKVIALVTKMSIQGDQDYHIILRSTESKASMIGEIPDPDCSYLSDFPIQREKFRVTRKQGDAIFNILKETNKPVLVEVTGVLFWDAPHFWLKGSSSTGREIHPVLEIKAIGK